MQVHWDWAWTMQDIIIESCGTGVIIVGGVRLPQKYFLCSEHYRKHVLTATQCIGRWPLKYGARRWLAHSGRRDYRQHADRHHNLALSGQLNRVSFAKCWVL